MNGLDLSNRRVWLAGGVVAALLIVLAAWLLIIGPKRSDTSDLRAQTLSVEQQNATLRQQAAVLQAESKNLSSYQNTLKQDLAALPADNDLSSYTRYLADAAKRTGVALSSITVGQAQGVTSTAPAATPSTAAASSATPSSATTPTSAPATAAATSAAPAQMSVTFTLQVKGSTDHDLAFLQAARTGPRSALVNSMQLNSATGSTSMTAQVTVFSAPLSASQLTSLRTLLQPQK